MRPEHDFLSVHSLEPLPVGMTIGGGGMRQFAVERGGNWFVDTQYSLTITFCV